MIRWAIIYDDDHVWLEYTEEQIKQALVKAFEETHDVAQAFERVRYALRQEAARH